MKYFLDSLQKKMMSDKGFHFVWMFFIASWMLSFLYLNPVLVIVIGVAIAVSKELIDKYVRKGRISILDIVFSILGIGAAIINHFFRIG